MLKAIEFGMEAGIQNIIPDIKAITPRDPARPPKDPSRPVTGRLKDSITYNKLARFSFEIGTLNQAPTYAFYLEFGTPKMPPRSYLRKGLIDNAEKLQSVVAKAIASRLS